MVVNLLELIQVIQKKVGNIKAFIAEFINKKIKKLEDKIKEKEEELNKKNKRPRNQTKRTKRQK